MANFSIEVESILDIDSSENVLLIAQWIEGCMRKAGQPTRKSRYELYFHCGELRIKCTTLNEFKEHSLGQDIRVYGYSIFYNLGKPNLIAFYIDKKRSSNDNATVTIQCDDRLIIQEVAKIMKAEKANFEQSRLQNASEIIIQGNNNQIGVINTGSNNTIKNQMHSSPKAKSGFWQGIVQFIVSNIVWVIIVAIILITLTVIGITQPDWLQF